MCSFLNVGKYVPAFLHTSNHKHISGIKQYSFLIHSLHVIWDSSAFRCKSDSGLFPVSHSGLRLEWRSSSSHLRHVPPRQGLETFKWVSRKVQLVLRPTLKLDHSTITSSASHWSRQIIWSIPLSVGRKVYPLHRRRIYICRTIIYSTKLVTRHSTKLWEDYENSTPEVS